MHAMFFAAVLLAQPVDLEMYAKIRRDGQATPQVMRLAGELVDSIGARLTGSPNLARANAWARRELAAMGCANVHEESWGEFGLGWRERNTWVRITEPDTAPLIARAAPWSPATRGPVTGTAVAVRGFANEQDFARHRGKLRGKIVLLGTAPSPPEVLPIEKPLFERLTDAQLSAFAAEPFEPPTGYEESTRRSAGAHFERMEMMGRLLAEEEPAAILVPSGNNALGGASGGTLYADTNYTFGWHVYRKPDLMRTPLAILATEHYGRISRLLDRGVPVRLQLNIDTEFTGPQQGVNVFADLPGVRPDETVMLTAHLDSWTAGTGATDDGAGVVIAMEAMRLLVAAGAKPRRTIRLALWSGEEQGSLGSRAWIARHVATIPTDTRSTLPEFLRAPTGPIAPKAGHAAISAVYTLDAGGGRIRGISTGNPALVDAFRRWLAPLADLGVTMIAPRSDCGGDCWSFQQAGIPTPSFKQDPLAYSTRTHHTNMDSYEHLIAADLEQAAIVVASTVYSTAMAEQRLARLDPNR